MMIIKRKTVLDLPLEEQKKSAELYGLPFEEWKEEMRKLLAASDEIEYASPLSEEEKAAKIKRIRENPDAIYTYRRIWGDDNLTIEEVIDEIEHSY